MTGKVPVSNTDSTEGLDDEPQWLLDLQIDIDNARDCDVTVSVADLRAALECLRELRRYKSLWLDGDAR